MDYGHKDCVQLQPLRQPELLLHGEPQPDDEMEVVVAWAAGDLSVQPVCDGGGAKAELHPAQLRELREAVCKRDWHLVLRQVEAALTSDDEKNCWSKVEDDEDGPDAGGEVDDSAYVVEMDRLKIKKYILIKLKPFLRILIVLTFTVYRCIRRHRRRRRFGRRRWRRPMFGMLMTLFRPRGGDIRGQGERSMVVLRMLGSRGQSSSAFALFRTHLLVEDLPRDAHMHGVPFTSFLQEKLIQIRFM